jgi:predicted dehydrogenase
MRFGLIGLGAIGEIRRAALARTPGCSLAAVSDTDSERARRFATDIAVLPSAEALFTSGTCDAVIISTPPDSHETLAISALESGKHVLVEKPMANSAAACQRMVESARRTGRLLAVGFNHRYFEAIRVVREAISSGAIGRLGHIRAYAGHVGLSEFKAPWMYSKDVMGGGTLMDNGIHVLDLVCHLMGSVDHVSGRVSSRIWELDVEDNAFAILRNRNGVLGYLHSSWTEWKGYHFFVEAYGDRGMARAYYAPMSSTIITLDRLGGNRSVQRNFYPTAILRERLFGWQDTVVRAFVQEIQDFVALAQGRGRGTIIARAEDGWQIARVAAAVYHSSNTGQDIFLD